MPTFWRLLGFLRPYRGGVLVSFGLAAAAMGAGVLIPYLVGRTVDEIRQGGVDLWPLAIAVAGAGLFRLGFSVARRLVAGRVSLGVEYDLRNRMYEHLHSLELEFFDSQQTGQLMSRSTVDLQSVRFFLGYGLVFILQSALTILIAAGVMVAVDPGLAAVALAPTPFVIWVAFRYGRLNRPATQEVQQRIAELTAEAEENIGGVRVVKAFAQEERQLRRFNKTVKRVFDQSMVSTRLRAFYSPFIGFAEGRDPREVSEMLNTYLEVAIPPIVTEHGGEIDSLIGDAIMATWGTRSDQPDHAERAVRAAAELQRETGRIADEHPGWPRFRAAVNTGEALVGVLGVESGRSYTVIGDTVNVAARLEARAPAGGVVIGADTLRAVPGLRVTALGELPMKGKEEPVDAYRLEVGVGG